MYGAAPLKNWFKMSNESKEQTVTEPLVTVPHPESDEATLVSENAALTPAQIEELKAKFNPDKLNL